MTQNQSKTIRRQALKVAGIYAVFGLTWILLSDRLLLLVTTDVEALARLQTFKGWLFVATTSALLYLLVRQALAARQSVEATLRESEARYRALFENSHTVMLLIDPTDGRIVDANPAACTFYGYDAAALRSMKISAINILSPEAIRAEMARAEATAQDHFHFHHRLASGEVREVEVFSGPIEFAGAQLLYSIVHDVTERRRAQSELRKLSMAVEQSPAAVMITDPEGRIEYVNPKFTRITGYTLDEVLGRNPRLLQSGEMFPEESRKLWETLAAGREWHGEFHNRRKDGSLFWEQASISPVRDAAGVTTHYVAVKEDITERKRYEEELEYHATHDELTGQANRALLHDRLAQSLHYADRSGRLVAIFLLDLDRFKVINDSLGHAFGDRLLCAVAQRLQQIVREADTVARLGGDEFVVLLAEVAELDDVGLLATKILRRLAEPHQLDGREILITASLGISLYPRDGSDGATLIRNADIAMYRAKQDGGGSFSFYAPEMNQRALETLELESALRHALERGEFCLYYQPKVDLATGHILGCEALVRWRHPQRGMVSPADFIPLAEETGLIVPLGTWVLQEACRQTRAWQSEGLPTLSIAVNLSARQFRKGDLPQLVRTILLETGLDPRWLELELTESMIIDNPAEAAALMAGLRRIGARLSLDDFGTGYSSLASLSRFPIDHLKIDRSFIEHIVTDPDSATIATAIIALAHRMRLRVIAEGVETEAQLCYLRRQGCDEIQGYFFSRPLPAEEFAALLREGRSLPTENQDGEVPTLLIVDDEPMVLAVLQQLLGSEGYRIFTAESAREGLELLARHRIQVILADQCMPQTSGIEFLSQVKSLHPETVRIILSGYADLETVMRSVNEGALYKFLVKPWDDEHLLAQVRDAFRYYQAVIRPRREEGKDG